MKKNALEAEVPLEPGQFVWAAFRGGRRCWLAEVVSAGGAGGRLVSEVDRVNLLDAGRPSPAAPRPRPIRVKFLMHVGGRASADSQLRWKRPRPGGGDTEVVDWSLVSPAVEVTGTTLIAPGSRSIVSAVMACSGYDTEEDDGNDDDAGEHDAPGSSGSGDEDEAEFDDDLDRGLSDTAKAMSDDTSSSSSGE
jgi:hypothetical protein